MSELGGGRSKKKSTAASMKNRFESNAGGFSKPLNKDTTPSMGMAALDRAAVDAEVAQDLVKYRMERQTGERERVDAEIEQWAKEERTRRQDAHAAGLKALDDEHSTKKAKHAANLKALQQEMADGLLTEVEEEKNKKIAAEKKRLQEEFDKKAAEAKAAAERQAEEQIV